MAAAHAHEQRRLAHGHEAGAVMNEQLLQLELLEAFLRYPSQLMLGHWPMHFVSNAGNLRVLLRRSHHAPEVDDRTRFGWRRFTRERERSVSHEDIADGICHVG